jgi:hypothetical protein
MENARRAAPASLAGHRAWRWVVMRTAVNFASGANVTGRLSTSPLTKNPGTLSSPGFLVKMAWR